MEDDQGLDDVSVQFPAISPEQLQTKRSHKWRALIGFWLLGLCNNYGYIVVLTGATDILQNAKIEKRGERQCTYIATGAILLADIIPCLCIKAVGPFLPFCVNIQIAVCVICSASAFFMIATFNANIVISIAAIVLTSLISGLGELTLLQYSAFFKRSVITAWSSGTGGAGIIGSVSYAFLTRFVPFSTTFYILMMVPLVMSISFWAVLPVPDKILKRVMREKNIPVDYAGKRCQWCYLFLERLRYIQHLFKYIIPFMSVYFFEYLINQTAFELISFENSPIKGQYKWLFVDYQLGVFIARTSGSLIHIDQIWILGILQVTWYFMPCFWVVLLLTLWEGLIGGATYVNTYRKISTEITDHEKKRFALAVTGNGDSIGITMAGIIAMYVHNAICSTPKPKRWSVKNHVA